MSSPYDLVVSLTSPTALRDGDRLRDLRDFSQELGWRPSYHLLEKPFVGQLATAHLIVEHGLEPSAVITFLSADAPFADLPRSDVDALMAISYNNLADWHIYVEREKVTYCFNLAKPSEIEKRPISRGDISGLTNQAFEQVVGRKPTPNLPALDQALISTIARWKRTLSVDLGTPIANEELSALFNGILFTRAVEDESRQAAGDSTRALLQEWSELSPSRRTLANTISGALGRLIPAEVPPWVVEEDRLRAFDSVDPDTARSLLDDFYGHPHVPYRYDFSIMSKHALSRIYERYSALLRVQETQQASFFPTLPQEELNKSYGSIYTPEFIARFFARFLRDQMLPPAFRTISSVDPSCGSGIFLRTLLELQCDPSNDGVTSDSIRAAFDNVLGVDVDRNATYATRLSLSLLHLVLTSDLPDAVPIVTAESIGYFGDRPDLESSYDAVIVNPPFISLERQSTELRERVTQFMGDDAEGRIDTYLAFLKLGLELLKPGGYGLFVLPHSFLLAENARNMRARLAREAVIHCLADLSAIRVFEVVESYVVLLIFQKRTESEIEPSASIIKCQEFVGHALEDFLQGKRAETKHYSIYNVGQEEFQETDWVVLPRAETAIRRRLRGFRPLSEFAMVGQGLVTGQDSVFLVDESTIPDTERGAFLPFLPDRRMERYTVPERTERLVFYPFEGSRKLSEEELRDNYRVTWDYLSQHRAELESRAGVVRGSLKNWWDLERPRPTYLRRPKIVGPHLAILPRFSFDVDGRYAVSRSPVIYVDDTGPDTDILYYLTAILNSPVCYWYLSTHSHKYGHGYAMVEVKTLRDVPIPDPAEADPGTLTRLMALVRTRLSRGADLSTENTIDSVVADLYGLSAAERNALGVE